MNNKITPNIWFHTTDGKLSEVIQYYKNIFGKDFLEGPITPLGKGPSGNAEMAEVKIFESTYSLMSTEKLHQKFNDSISFIIKCQNQDEIDKFWNYFTKEGKAVQCGWCNDKYDLRWQIIPNNLGELMNRPGAWEVMMGQKKIIIEDYLKLK